MTATALSFQNTQFDIIDRAGQPWLRLHQIGTALGYSRSDAINKIYQSNTDEFTERMTALVKLPELNHQNDVAGQMREVRIFSLRGCHLLAMLSRTKIAKEFRKWVLDVLDSQTQYGLKELPDTSVELAALVAERLKAEEFPPEVLAAIERRTQILTMRQYDHIKKQVQDFARKAAQSAIPGVTLAQRILSCDLPASDLLFVHSDDLWLMTQRMGNLPNVLKGIMEAVHVLENNTGRKWYQRD